MRVRAAPNSDFQILTCEARVPRHTREIQVAGRRLRPPPARPRRIAVVGDTGCRLKDGESLDDGFQACNDPDDWEFAKVAEEVARFRPDLVIQLGDYIYREEACPEGDAGCAGSPFNSPGMRLETWFTDYFTPASPMLEAAPMVFVRGDHEKCERAGRGFFRFLDPFPLRDCTDFSHPYALDFQGLQLVVMDTVQAEDTSLSPDVVIERYERDFRQAERLASGGTWLLSHRPIWALRPTVEDGSEVEVLNVTLQEALPGPLPRAVELVLTAHIHLGEVLSFSGRRPPQMVVGMGGTKLLPNVSVDVVGMMIDGETITDAAFVSSHGFFAFEPLRHRAWRTTIFDESSEVLAVCRLAGHAAPCREWP